MNNIMAKIQRFGRIRIRELHTIISRETIAPSSPTPPHLKIYNLSPLDKLFMNKHMPFIFFYPNYNIGDINILKKSLSQSLTQYYPFAGRLLTPYASHIDCNDQGIEFVEASINSRLEDFILKKRQDEIDQLVPNSLASPISNTCPDMGAIQLNRFTCGGAAVALSISHKVADALTMANFINHWAAVTRGGSPINPTFLVSSPSDPDISMSLIQVDKSDKKDYERRRFLFPNSKLNELKNKVNAMGTYPMNPTRVESLSSLLFKCAASTKPGSLQPLLLYVAVNLRKRMSTMFPKLGAGNLVSGVTVKVMDSSQIKLNEVITSLRKELLELQGVKDIEEVCKKLEKSRQGLFYDDVHSYVATSVCGFPFYEVDFGWGKPLHVMIAVDMEVNAFTLMDSASRDGIEATVQLEKEDMAIFEKDEELLAYAHDI